MVSPPLVADQVLRDLGRRIAELRAARAFTQERLAETAEVTVQYLQRVERGRANLTVRSLVRIANLLGVSVGELFDPPRVRSARVGRPRRLEVAEQVPGIVAYGRAGERSVPSKPEQSRRSPGRTPTPRRPRPK